MTNLAIIKLLLSFFIIVSLAEISKRVSPQLGGTLSGLPLGAGLSIYFISYEQGIDFTIQGIPWGIAGLSASIFFCFVYFLIVRFNVSSNKLVSIIMASTTGIIAFLGFGFLISSIEIDLLKAVIIFMTIFILNILIINKLIDLQDTVHKTSTTFIQLAMRGIVVGMILLLITGVASIVGSRWAVILSAFPSTLFPLLLVVHFEAGSKSVQAVIHAFSYSISTLVVFYFSVMYFVPMYGLNIGFILIYAVCIIYIAAFKKIQSAFTGNQLKSKAT